MTSKTIELEKPDQKGEKEEEKEQQDPADDFSTPSLNWIRFGYLAIFGGYGFFYPFMNLLFEAKHFSTIENGVLNSIPAIMTLFVNPIVAWFAETRRIQHELMYFSLIFSAFFFAVAANSFDKTTVALSSIAFFGINSFLLPLYDEHCIMIITTKGEKFRSSYGSFRTYGAYSWVGTSLLGSFLISQYGFSLLPLFFLTGNFGLFLCLFYTSSHRRPVEQKELEKKKKGAATKDTETITNNNNNKNEDASSHHSYLDVLRYVFETPRFVLWVFALSVIGAGYGAISTYLFLFLQQELAAPPILFGLCVVFTVLIEIPLFNNAQRLHERFSDSQILLSAYFAWCIRGLGYSLLTNPWYVLPLETLHGFTFGCLWLSGIHFFSSRFPTKFSNSAVSIVHASCFGLGACFGPVIAGHLYDGVGPRKMFQLFALGIGICGVIFWIVDKQFEKAEEEEQEEKERQNKIRKKKEQEQLEEEEQQKEMEEKKKKMEEK